MADLFHKLQCQGQGRVTIIDSPSELLPLWDSAPVEVSLLAEPPLQGVLAFVLCFVSSRRQIAERMAALAPRLEGDAVLWFCYPKSSSTRYRCDFNRDSGWEPLGERGWEPVRQVAVDQDWSALRFRKAEYIPSLTRQTQGALSEAGRRRTNPRD